MTWGIKSCGKADGSAWHENHPFRDQAARDRVRDAELMNTFSLPVFRFSEAEIETITWS